MAYRVRGIKDFSQPDYVELIKACHQTKPFKVAKMLREWFYVAVLQTKITKRAAVGANFKNWIVVIYVDIYKEEA